jgi:hypothetical protein
LKSGGNYVCFVVRSFVPSTPRLETDAPHNVGTFTQFGDGTETWRLTAAAAGSGSENLQVRTGELTFLKPIIRWARSSKIRCCDAAIRSGGACQIDQSGQQFVFGKGGASRMTNHIWIFCLAALVPSAVVVICLLPRVLSGGLEKPSHYPE